MSKHDLASFLQLFAVLILVAPAGLYMLRHRRQSLRHLGIWALIAAVAAVAVILFG